MRASKSLATAAARPSRASAAFAQLNAQMSAAGGAAAFPSSR